MSSLLFYCYCILHVSQIMQRAAFYFHFLFLPWKLSGQFQCLCNTDEWVNPCGGTEEGWLLLTGHKGSRRERRGLSCAWKLIQKGVPRCSETQWQDIFMNVSPIQECLHKISLFLRGCLACILWSLSTVSSKYWFGSDFSLFPCHFAVFCFNKLWLEKAKKFWLYSNVKFPELLVWFLSLEILLSFSELQTYMQ